MTKDKRAIVALLTLGFLCAAGASAQDAAAPTRLATTRETPHAFGTDDYTVTTISAVGLYPGNAPPNYFTTGSLGRNGNPDVLTQYFAPLDLPGGAVIDFIGLNSNTDTAFAYGVELFSRHKDGVLTSIGTFSSTVHGWDTDFNSTPIGFTWSGKSGDALIVKVEQASNSNLEFFGWVEVWWHRSVSPAPATQTFNDVAPGDFGYQYIEALAASGITGGCGGNNYCPNANLTRAQMAVFLAKALGLHWPGN